MAREIDDDLTFKIRELYRKYFPDRVMLDPVRAVQALREIDFSPSAVAELKDQVCDLESDVRMWKDTAQEAEDRADVAERNVASLRQRVVELESGQVKLG